MGFTSEEKEERVEQRCGNGAIPFEDRGGPNLEFLARRIAQIGELRVESDIEGGENPLSRGTCQCRKLWWEELE